VGDAPRVVVTGVGAVTSFGEGVDAFWTGALSGRSAIREMTRFDVSRFRARQAAFIDFERAEGGEDRDVIFARAAAHEAAAACPDFAGERAGLVLGTTLAGNAPLTESAPASGLGHGALGALARALALEHGARGPVSTVSVACASGSAAIGLGAQWIREGRADRVLAGGADALSPFVFSGFDALRALSPTVARPFDAVRDGLTLGEGAGFLLLEDEGRARRRGAKVLARVAGYGSGSDAHHMTRPDPSGGGLVRATEAALREAARSPSELGFVSAHGTGTTFNDAMEEAALAHVLGVKARTVPVQGIKGAIGHTLGAAGALEAILSVLVLGEQRVPPTAGHRTSRPDSPLAIVAGVPFSPDRPILLALSTSSAFGGTNTALVLERT
jgi:3-oxoacyl-[acyl-carrier-protein] synthase II